jgi:phosphoribulokinase
VTNTILRRMYDYVHYISPQFSRTHVNFQRVPTVDTSNPFVAREIPTPEESLVVIRFTKPEAANFPYLVAMCEGLGVGEAVGPGRDPCRFGMLGPLFSDVGQVSRR